MKLIITLVSVFLLAQTYLTAVDYVITTKQFQQNGKGYVSLPATTYGQGQVLTVTFEFATEEQNACVLSMGKDLDLLDVIVRGGFLVIRDSNTESTYNAKLAIKQYYHVSIQFKNGGSGSELSLYINGKDVSGSLSTRNFKKFSNSQRTNSYLGRCLARNGQAHSTGVIYFDEFRIFDRQLTFEEIQVLANPNVKRPIDDRALVVYYPFNEGQGSIAYGRPGTFSQESYQAALMNGARFTTRNEQGTLSCSSTGDPHVTTFTGQYFTPTHIKAYSRLLSCSHNTQEGFFSIQALHDFGHPSHPKATLNRELSVKYGDTIVKINLNLDVFEKNGNSWVARGKPASVKDIHFEYLASNNQVKVYGSPFAVMHVYKQGTTHMDLYFKASSTLCKGKSYCNDNRDFIRPIEYEEGTPVPEAPPLAEPPVSAPYDPCVENPAISELAKKVCGAKFKAGSPQYEACVFDVCATGDPTIPVEDEECLALKKKLIEEGKTKEAEELPCIDNDCRCINGECNESNQCLCFPGYAGPDCSQEYHLLNLTMDHNMVFNDRAVHLSSHLITVNSPDAMTISNGPFKLNDWAVEDSILLYVAAIRGVDQDALNYKYYLYLVGDISSQKSVSSKAITFSAPAGVVTKHLSGAVMTDNTVTFDPFKPSGILFDELPGDWCVNFDFTGLTGNDGLFKQVVVGSGNKLGKLDVIKVHENTHNYVKICGKEIVNPCAQYDNCRVCMEQPECGWCRSNQRCLFGNPAGPVEGSSCPVWTFTYDDTVSRRVNAEFGVPVSPKKQEVFLVSAGHDLSQLPVEITVDMGQSKGSVFDLAIVSPNAGTDFALFRDNVLSYMIGLDTYPNIGISFSTYDSNGLKKLTILETYAGATSSIPRDIKNVAQTNAVGDVDQALREISGSKHPNWRSSTRHVVFIVVGDSTPQPDMITETRNALLSQSILPVFAVRSGKFSVYKNYVKDLGFGAVVLIDNAGSNVGVLLRDSVDIASKAVSLVPTQEGYIKLGTEGSANLYADLWNIHGLQQNMRGRMQFPMERSDTGNEIEVKKSILVAPGFGTATIENLVTDKPTANSKDVDMQQEQPLPDNPELSGQIIELSGQALNPSDPISIEIISFGPPFNNEWGNGKFYQLPDNIATLSSISQLTEIDVSQGSVVVQNAAGKIVYVPPTGENVYSVSREIGRNAFTHIKYRVVDSCTESDDHTIGVYIAYENNKPPVNNFVTPQGVENKALLITLDGVDFREHDLKAIVKKAPYQLKDGKEQKVGRLFQYSDSVYNTLSSVNDIYRELPNLENILQNVAEIVTPNSEVTDSKRRVIFIPDIYTNSENKPESGEYQVEPRISYIVEQIRNPVLDAPTDKLLQSAETDHAFSIQWVNQPPSVDVTPVPSGLQCTHNEPCQFNQNLGTFFPDLPTPVFISAAVKDIENEQLSVIIKSVACGEGSKLTDPSSQNIVQGLVIPDFTKNVWSTAMTFVPKRDGHGDNYCTITYKAFDGELESLDEATVVINIKQVNQPVFSEAKSITAYNGHHTSATVAVGDIDDLVVEGTIVGCTKFNDNPFTMVVNGVEIDDSIDCENFINIPIGEVLIDETSTHGFYDISIECENCVVVGDLITLEVQFRDGNEGVDGRPEVPYSYFLRANYLNINAYGQFWRGDDEENKSNEYYHAVAQKIPTQDDTTIDKYVSLGINITDEDALHYSVYVKVQIEQVDGPARLTTKDGLHGIVIVEYVTPYSVEMTGTLAQINKIMNENYLLISSFKSGKFNVTYTYNDFMNTGACNPGAPRRCERISHATLLFTAADTNNIPDYIAGGVSAGAVAIGAAAAIAAWMKFKRLRAPADGPDPWLMDDQTEGVVDNPMYEQRGGESENPLYEQAAE